MDCGPTCLRMVAKYHKRSLSLQKIRKLSETTRSGSSLQGIADAAEKIGFRTLGVKINFQKPQEEAPLPCVVFWNERHFVVVYKDLDGGAKNVEITHVYGKEEAFEVIKLSSEDYDAKYSNVN